MNAIKQGNAITSQEAATLIQNTNGKMFRVTFTKRSNGESRDMVCRTGVVPEGGGNGRRYDPADHNLVTVYELVTDPETPRDAQGRFNGPGNAAAHYRAIPLDAITALRIGGESYLVN